MLSQSRRSDLSLDSSHDARGTAGLLLIGHGTRDPDGQREFASLASRIRARLPDVPCEACSLEFAEPTIGQGVATLAQRGVMRVTAMPLLLFAAGHVKQDIPSELAHASVCHSGLTIDLAGYLGCQPSLIELSAQRFEEAIQNRREHGDPIDPAEALLLMVGRGSHDPKASAEMVRFASIRAGRTPVGGVEVCYTAMAEPSLEAGLALAAESPFREIVVQPHLLFRGELLGRIGRAVTARQRDGSKRWTLTAHLGADELLVEAVLKIAGF